jgi:1-phosphofructokinase
MAGAGAMLVDENKKRYRIGVPEGKVRNSVGAGDSMVAGFVAGYMKTKDYETALKMGTAAGSATAFSDGLAKAVDIDNLFKGL